ncbi:MAG: aspartyl protease family protein [Rikenellaceae bacterium]|nr:aspartyl protease family protein [Rikenellaceae bacterium]
MRFNKSWVRRISIFLLPLCFLVLLLAQTAEGIRQTLAGLSAALKNQDTESVQEYLAPSFSIHTAQWPSAKSWLERILNSQSVESIELDAQEPVNAEDPRLVGVVLRFSDQRVRQSQAAFDEENRLLYLDFFDRLFGSSRFRESRYVGTLPFELEGQSIVLPLRLNDFPQTFRFLLDTGADGMAIRKSLADSLNLDVGHVQQAHVVGGHREVEISHRNRVHLSDSIVLEEQNMALFPDFGPARRNYRFEPHSPVCGCGGLRPPGNRIVYFRPPAAGWPRRSGNHTLRSDYLALCGQPDRR